MSGTKGLRSLFLVSSLATIVVVLAWAFTTAPWLSAIFSLLVSWFVVLPIQLVVKVLMWVFTTVFTTYPWLVWVLPVLLVLGIVSAIGSGTSEESSSNDSSESDSNTSWISSGSSLVEPDYTPKTNYGDWGAGYGADQGSTHGFGVPD